MSTIPVFYREDNNAYFDFEVNAGASFPDWDSSLSVLFYDSLGVLKLTATTSTLHQATDGDGKKYVYIDGINTSTWALGIVEVRVYAKVLGVNIEEYPTIVDGFLLRSTSATPYVVVGESWIVHNLENDEGDPVLNVETDDVLVKYWHKLLAEFRTKVVDVNHFVNVGGGEYRILYDEEIISSGPFISLMYPADTDELYFKNSESVYTVTSTVSGTCVVSGQFISFDGTNITSPMEVVVENIYNPVQYNIGGVIERTKKYYSDIDGYIELTILQGMRVRISIQDIGIMKSITVPEQSAVNLFELLNTGENEYEPL